MGVHIVEHPILADSLATLRDRDTGTAEFRAALRRAAAVLFLEATRDLATDAGAVETPLAKAHARRLVPGGTVLVPVLRAGLGMLEGVEELLPGARVAHIGVRRDEATAEPHEYYRNVPRSAAGAVAFVLDPMLATGGTLVKVLGILAGTGVSDVRVLSIVAAPEGVRAVRAAVPEVQVYVASVDDGLDPRKYILPGLGDAGDRFFGTEG